jgi:hypothetical protein
MKLTILLLLCVLNLHTPMQTRNKSLLTNKITGKINLVVNEIIIEKSLITIPMIKSIEGVITKAKELNIDGTLSLVFETKQPITTELPPNMKLTKKKDNRYSILLLPHLSNDDISRSIYIDKESQRNYELIFTPIVSHSKLAAVSEAVSSKISKTQKSSTTEVNIPEVRKQYIQGMLQKDYDFTPNPFNSLKELYFSATIRSLSHVDLLNLLISVHNLDLNLISSIVANLECDIKEVTTKITDLFDQEKAIQVFIAFEKVRANAGTDEVQLKLISNLHDLIIVGWGKFQANNANFATSKYKEMDIILFAAVIAYNFNPQLGEIYYQREMYNFVKRVILQNQSIEAKSNINNTFMEQMKVVKKSNEKEEAKEIDVRNKYLRVLQNIGQYHAYLDKYINLELAKMNLISTK